MSKPFIPIAKLTAASERPGGVFRMEFADANGLEGVAEFAPGAVGALQMALKHMAATGPQDEVATIEVQTSAKVAMADGGYGLMLGLKGGIQLLVKIPQPNVAALRLQLAELDGMASVVPSPGQKPS